MELDKTTVMSGIILLLGGGNAYQQQNPQCDDWKAQVEIVREAGLASEIRTRDRVMEWVDRTCPTAATISYLSYLPEECVLRSCIEWPCEDDRECLDCTCNDEGWCE